MHTPIRRIATVLAANLVLVLGACSKETATVDEPQPAVEPNSKTASAEPPVEDLSETGLPFDPLTDLLTRVEGNEWTLEQGLIFHLKVIAGEIESDRYKLSEMPVEVGDLIVVARAYLETGENDEAKADIQRLLDAVDISTEDLLKYAEPIDLDTTGASSRSLPSVPEALLSVLLPVAQAQEPPGCAPFWTGGVRDSAQPPGACFGVHEWDYRGYTHQIFFPLPWTRNSDPRFEFVRSAKNAINKSLDTYVSQMGLTVNSINLHFLEGESEDNFLAAMWPEGGRTSSSAACRIKAYGSSYMPDIGSDYESGGLGDVDLNFRQVIAHETFHCMQLWNLTRQMYGRSGIGSIELGAFEAVRKWWSEGSAEYFSNVVYPCNQLEWSRIDGFDEHAAEWPIFSLKYENTVTFQYFANELGNRGVFDILRSMPTRGSVLDQIRALDSTPAADKFHSFGQRYIENNVRDSCTAGSEESAYLPLTPAMEDLAIQEGASYEFESASYQLNTKRLIFVPGDLQIRYEATGTVADDSYEDLVAGGWHAPPESVNAVCSEANGNLLFTSTRATGPLKYMIRVLGEPPPEFHLDRCLVGNWRSTDASAREIAQWVASNPLTLANMTTELADVKGTIHGTIEERGRASGSMINFAQKYVSRIEIGDKTITNATTVVINGASTGRYSAQDSKLTVWGVCTESTAEATVLMDGELISDKTIDLQAIADDGPIPGMEGVAYDLGGLKSKGSGLVATQTDIPTKWVFSYRCRGNTLEVDPPDGLDRRKDGKGMGDRPPWKFRSLSDVE